MPASIRFSSIYLAVPGAIKTKTDGVRDYIDETSLSFTIGLDRDDALLVPRDDFRKFARPMTVKGPLANTANPVANAYDITLFSDGYLRVNSTNPNYDGEPLKDADRGINPSHWQSLATQLLLRLNKLRAKQAVEPGKEVAFFHPFPADAPLPEITPKPAVKFPTEATFQAFALKSAIDSSILRDTMLSAQRRQVKERLGALADQALGPDATA